MIFVANSGVSFQMMGLCHYYAWSIMHVALAALFSAVGGLGQNFAQDTPGCRLLHGSAWSIMHVALAALFGAVGGLGQIFARDTPGRRLLHGADAIIMVPLHR